MRWWWLILGLGLAACQTVEPLFFNRGCLASITTARLIVRLEPHNGGVPLTALVAGVYYPVIGRTYKNYWYAVEANRFQGWVPADEISLIGNCSNTAIDYDERYNRFVMQPATTEEPQPLSTEAAP